MASADDSAREREFRHSRRIDASPESVFAAFADPARVARWWGPSGFSSSIHTFEFRNGGQWTLTMHGPDGTDYPNELTFVDIDPPRRVVIEHVAEVHHFVLTVTLEADGTGTRVDWRQAFDSAAHKEEIAHIVHDANEQNLDRLTAEVLQVR